MDNTSNELSNKAQQRSRIDFLDILRGISICFICFANIQIFAGYLFYTDEYKATFEAASLNNILENIELIFIHGKFYTLFSLLFGVGMSIQFIRFKDDLAAYKRYMCKRLAVLLLIGLIHIWLIWLGDIITLYAVLGFLVLMLFHCSSRTLVIVGVVSILLPILHAVLMGIIGFYPGVLFSIFTQKLAELGVPPGDLFEQALYLVMTNNIELHFTAKFYDPLVRVALIAAEGRIFKVFGIICLGVVAGRHIIKHDLLSNKPFLLKTALLGFVVGIPANIAMAILTDASEPSLQLLRVVAYAFGVVPLALAYAATLALVYKRAIAFFGIFAPLGRMALSNYLSQSVIAIILFNGFAGALGGKLGLSNIWMIGFCVVTVQIILSYFYMLKFKQGPVEYLWRRLIPKS